MASQVLNQIDMESSQPFMLRDILPGAAWAPYRAPAQPMAKDMDCASVAVEQEGNCVRGFLVAVCLECAMVAGGFGVWQVWHLIR